MDVALGVLIVLALAATVASTEAVLVAQWRGLGEALRRVRPERRRAAALGGAGAVLYIAGASALLILAPWGPDTWLVLFASVAVVMIVLTVALVARGPRADR